MELMFISGADVYKFTFQKLKTKNRMVIKQSGINLGGLFL